jgi:hypothetical protein
MVGCGRRVGGCVSGHLKLYFERGVMCVAHRSTTRSKAHTEEIMGGNDPGGSHAPVADESKSTNFGDGSHKIVAFVL